MRYVILLIMGIINLNLFSQIEGNSFKSFADTLHVKNKYVIEHHSSHQVLYFLGEITDKQNKTFKVISSINKFGNKGVNDIVFVAEDDIYIYRCNLPEDLPIAISYNKLIFKGNKSMKIEILKNILCTPIECFDKIN